MFFQEQEKQHDSVELDEVDEEVLQGDDDEEVVQEVVVQQIKRS